MQSGLATQVRVDQAGTFSGCQFILRTRDGKQLVPIFDNSNPYAFQLGEDYLISYELLTDAVYGCTLESVQPVKILTCVIQENGKLDGTGGIKPERQMCAWTTDVFAIPWMVQLIRQIDPYKITRFQYHSIGAYYFESKRGHYLFDCSGNFMCQEAVGVVNCLLNQDLKDPYVILVRNY